MHLRKSVHAGMWMTLAEKAGRGDEAADHKLTLALPAVVARQLRARMAAEDTTIRALVLAALKEAGYAVPAAEIGDRRRGRTAGGRRGGTP